MSEHHHAARPQPPALGSVLRTALAILLAYAVLGAVAGVVWETVWTPPGQIIVHHHVLFDSYESLRRVFSGTGLYALVAAVTSALVALVVSLMTRGRELLVLLLVVIGSALAAAVMWRVGTLLGPDDAASIAAHTTGRRSVPGALTVSGKSPYAVWPMASLFVLALVFFARPSPYSSHDGPEPWVTDHREPDSPPARHR
jgi:hypothetical protein